MPSRNAATKTALRYIAILQLIPEAPNSISTSQMLRRLSEDHGHQVVSQRSIQRDLEALSGQFPITSRLDGRQNRWSIMRNESLLQVPSMGQSTALALRLAEEYLIGVLPHSVMGLLGRYFETARGILTRTPLAEWPQKVRIIGRGPRLAPPRIIPEVQEAVYQGLLESRKVNVTYKRRGASRAKTYPLNPLGIVSREGVIYLVASVWDYDDVAHYALHRMTHAEVSPEVAHLPAGFRLSEHVDKEQQFSYPVSGKKINLKLVFPGESGLHLLESKLSSDQVVTKLWDGRIALRATVMDSDELRWWILGFGPNVQVQAPASLRDAIRDQLRAAARLYA